ncbi:MAG TPA: hypothetical protein ACFYD6_11275 [Candidatus Brocadiia bacterium]|nr:hypothetical protein [Candidatus Brocadiales bacterium]
MDKRTILIILIATLIATGVYNFYHFSNRRKPRSNSVGAGFKPTPTSRMVERNPEKPIQKVSSKASPRNLLLTLPEGWGRNPFLTPAEIKQIQAAKNPFTEKESEPLPQYELTSILISGALKVAVIDGKIVSPGDSIGREIVNEISTDGVVLAMGGNLRMIKLKQGKTEIKVRTP